MLELEELVLPLVSVAVTAELLDELLVSAYELLDVLLESEVVTTPF